MTSSLRAADCNASTTAPSSGLFEHVPSSSLPTRVHLSGSSPWNSQASDPSSHLCSTHPISSQLSDFSSHPIILLQIIHTHCPAPPVASASPRLRRLPAPPPAAASSAGASRSSPGSLSFLISEYRIFQLRRYSSSPGLSFRGQSRRTLCASSGRRGCGASGSDGRGAREGTVSVRFMPCFSAHSPTLACLAGYPCCHTTRDLHRGNAQGH